MPRALPTDSYESLKIAISVMALTISMFSLIVAQLASRRAKRAEDIKALLGEKEAVAFAGLRLLRDGLPKNDKQRELVIPALVQACLFEGSDRARALLYMVIERNRPKYGKEIKAAVEGLSHAFERMNSYNFNQDELDLSRGRLRLGALKRVVDGQ